MPYPWVSGEVLTAAALNAEFATALAAIGAGVDSFNTRTGAVTLLGSDVTSAGGALLASPTFTGTVTIPGGAITNTTIAGSTGSFTALTMGGTTATGFGTAVGSVPIWANHSGFPALQTTNRVIFERVTTAAADFADLQLKRTTSFTGGGSTNAMLYLDGAYGANDTSNNRGILLTTATSATTGAGNLVTVFSQATRNASATTPIWSMIAETRDLTGLPSSTANMGSQVSMEIDVRANKLDDGTNSDTYGGIGKRKGLNIVCGRYDSTDTADTTFSNGLWFTTAIIPSGDDIHASISSAIGFATGTNIIQALDTRGAQVPSTYSDPLCAVRMLAGHVVDFSGGAALTSNAGKYLQYQTSGTARLRYMAGATEAFSVSDAGALTAPQINVTTATGPNIRSGTGAASGTQPKGSLWMRTDGGVGTTMYVSQGGGTWNAVAGV